MKVSEIATCSAAVIKPNGSLREACEKMRDKDIGFLPVCDGDKIRGVVTDRDIATRGIAAGLDPLKNCVKDVMTEDVVCIYDDQDALEAARLMEVKQIRRLLVLNRQKRLLGILSLGDVSTHLKDKQLTGEVLERVSEPSMPRQAIA